MSKEDILKQQHQEFLRKKKRESIRYALLGLAGIAVFLLLWELVCRMSFVNTRYLPAPTEVFKAFIFKLSNRSPDGNTLLENIWASMQVAGLGFVLAIVIGVPLGLFMGWFEPFGRFINPVFELVRPIPPIALIPLIVAIVGVNLQARALIIFFATFVVCTLNAYAGIRSTSQALINVAKTFGAGNFETFWKIGVPSAMPMVFTGIQLSLAGAWSTLVAAEMLASNAGLGNMLNCARKVARPDIVVFSMVIIGALGALFNAVVRFFEKRRLRWKKSD
ncbi:MAG: ABC transporter permease [Gemmiger sp.]